MTKKPYIIFKNGQDWGELFYVDYETEEEAKKVLAEMFIETPGWEKKESSIEEGELEKDTNNI